MAPRLTVAVPAYNHAASIVECIKSVLGQQNVDLRCIVIDDGSTDDTAALVSSLADPRLELRRNVENLGLVGNHNACLAAAATELLLILHADDVLLPGALRRIVKAMCDPSTVLAFGPRLLETDDADYAQHRGDLQRDLRPIPPRMSGSDLLRRLLRHRALDNSIGEPSSVAFRVEAARAAGGFDPQKYMYVDLALWCRLLPLGEVAWVDEAVSIRRHHRGAASAQPGRLVEMQFERLEVLRSVPVHQLGSHRTTADVLWLGARHALAAVVLSVRARADVARTVRRSIAGVGRLLLQVAGAELDLGRRSGARPLGLLRRGPAET